MPKLQQKAVEIRAARDAIEVPNEKLLKRQHRLAQRLTDTRAKMRKVWHQPQHILRFLVPGRLVRIKHNDTEWGSVLFINWDCCFGNYIFG